MAFALINLQLSTHQSSSWSNSIPSRLAEAYSEDAASGAREPQSQANVASMPVTLFMDRGLLHFASLHHTCVAQCHSLSRQRQTPPSIGLTRCSDNHGAVDRHDRQSIYASC